MKKVLISLLVGVTILGVGCGNKSVDTNNTTNDIEVVETKVDEKREEFLQKVEDYMQQVVDDYNKKHVEDKIELRREDNVITYHMPFADAETMTEWSVQYPQEDEFISDYAKKSRQLSVTMLSEDYDEIVEKIGDDYEFFLRNENSQGGEMYLIVQYGKDGYEIQYDLFEELGY